MVWGGSPVTVILTRFIRCPELQCLRRIRREQFDGTATAATKGDNFNALFSIYIDVFFPQSNLQTLSGFVAWCRVPDVLDVSGGLEVGNEPGVHRPIAVRTRWILDFGHFGTLVSCIDLSFRLMCIRCGIAGIGYQ